MGNHIAWGGVGKTTVCHGEEGESSMRSATSLVSAWIIEPIGVKPVGSALSAARCLAE